MSSRYGSIIYSKLPFLRLDIEFPHEQMLSEARSVVDRFVPHHGDRHSDTTLYREDGTAGWYALTLHGQGERMTLSHADYGIGAEAQHLHYHWTEASSDCPVTTDFFTTVFPATEYGRIRFMLLRPGGGIAFHTDYAEPKLASMSFALSHPPGCHFDYRMGEEEYEIPFTPGVAFALNLSYEHCVVNTSAEDRFHIIVHLLRSTDGYRDLILRSHDKYGDMAHALQPRQRDGHPSASAATNP
jgi:hypothetical protein